MPDSLLVPPTTDPTPLFELFRGSYGTELLTAAVTHFDIFRRLASRARSFSELRQELELEQRSAHVLFTALAAFGLLRHDATGGLELTPLAREHLLPGQAFYVGDYFSLAAQSPGVQAMAQRLKANQPANADAEHTGAAFIYREGMESAMEKEKSARFLTMALAGRARNVAPLLAERVDLEGATCLLDVAGGSGIYSIAFLQKYPGLKAVIWDRPEVLKVAAEMADTFGVGARLTCVPGDMFQDVMPEGADVILLSNVLHDWDVTDNLALIRKCARALPAQGRLLIHDVFLNDTLTGPLPVALYSAALFSLTEGRAYSAAEFRHWLHMAGLVPSEIVPTLIHCGVLTGIKR